MLNNKLMRTLGNLGLSEIGFGFGHPLTNNPKINKTSLNKTHVYQHTLHNFFLSHICYSANVTQREKIINLPNKIDSFSPMPHIKRNIPFYENLYPRNFSPIRFNGGDRCSLLHNCIITPRPWYKGYRSNNQPDQIYGPFCHN